MGRRHDKRLRIALPVTVSGVDGDGNRFTRQTSTIEIGANGLRLRDVPGLHQCGQPVQVEYCGKRAGYRVSWIGAHGTCWEGMIGLEGVERARLLFASHLPASDDGAAERRDQERPHEERRRYPRCSCAAGVRLWENDIEHAVSARVNEISLGGCYAEIMSPMRVGTALHMELELGGHKLRLDGVVRAAQPMMGMGIEFTRMGAAEAEQLHRIVGDLGGNVASLREPAGDAVPSLSTALACELGEAVLRWFGAHETLSRQEFLKLVERTQSAARELAGA